MADLKSIANMQIGGPKYPKKRRINLYQKQVKKGKIAAELGVFVVFMGLVYGFSQFGVVRLLRKADQAEAVYAATEQQLSALQKSNEGYSEVQAEYAHYGNGYLTEEERQLPDRRKMIFPLTAVSTVSITSDQMALEGRIPNGSSFPELVRDAEADPDARYVTASLEETVQKEGEERVLAASKPVGVSMTVFFNVPEEDGEKQ